MKTPFLSLFLLPAPSSALEIPADIWYDPAGPHVTHGGDRDRSSVAPGGEDLAGAWEANQRALAPVPTSDDPVMAGYDLVEYHNLQPFQDGVAGSPDISHRHSNNFLYYFSSEQNKQSFIGDPLKYLPKYGGFCAWGIAWEYPEEGWPWAADHMGPPCGPRDGWAIIEGSLYCSIWRSYQDDFNSRFKEGVRLADARWAKFYGSESGGPQNNGCYAWNWQECYKRSIHTAVNWEKVQLLASPTPSPEKANTPVPTEILFPSDDEVQQIVTWSKPDSAMKGDIVWRWTLDELGTTSPSLIIEITAAGLASDEYIAFGVAEVLMQGALVACSEKMATASISRTSLPTSHCVTLWGDGMGTTVPDHDPVNPHVLFSSRNETHYAVQFSASLFGCWAHPRLPARVLFAKGKVSGDGAPQPHLNDGRNREAKAGIKFLSVVQGYDDQDIILPVAVPELKSLPGMQQWKPVEGSHAGSVTILDGRVTVEHELFRHDAAEIISIGIYNVAFGSHETYIAFGLAESVMNGLVISCAPRIGVSNIEVTAKCHQWRGQGTNLLPRNARTDAGGWFLTSVTSNGTHFNYTFAGRIHEVTDLYEGDTRSSDGISVLRGICAIGRSTPDSGTPLIHQARDRAGFSLQLRDSPESTSLSSSAPRKHIWQIITLVLSALNLFT